MRRIGLFLATNIVIMATMTIVFTILQAVLSTFFPELGQSSLGGTALFSLVVGFTGAFVSLAMSRKIAKSWMNVRVIDPRGTRTGAEIWLQDTVFELCLKAGLKHMPEVGIYPSREINAFATGPTKKRSLIAVSSGLFAKMDTAAIEAVLAHEVAHIKNGDMVTQTLIQGVVNTFAVFFSRLIAKILTPLIREEFSNWVYLLLSFLFEMLFTFFGSLIVFAHSRHREFAADRTASELVGKEKMIHALRLLLGDQTECARFSDSAMRSMQISSRRRWINWLSTHPPLEKRITMLEA